MRLINDKKGLWLLKRVLNLVITIIVILLLIIFIVILFKLFTAESDLEKMEKQLDKIISGVKKVDSSGGIQFLIFFPPSPEEGFHVRSIKNFNDGGCAGTGNCLCVCNDFPCRRGREISTTMICKNLEIKTNIKTISILGLKIPDGFTQKQIEHERKKAFQIMNYSFDLEDYIRFEELTRIIIKDDGGTIKIMREEDLKKDKTYFIKGYTEDDNPYRPKSVATISRGSTF